MYSTIVLFKSKQYLINQEQNQKLIKLFDKTCWKITQTKSFLHQAGPHSSSGSVPAWSEPIYECILYNNKYINVPTSLVYVNMIHRWQIPQKVHIYVIHDHCHASIFFILLPKYPTIVSSFKYFLMMCFRNKS